MAWTVARLRSRLPGITVTSFTPSAPCAPSLHAGISSSESVADSACAWRSGATGSDRSMSAIASASAPKPRERWTCSDVEEPHGR